MESLTTRTPKDPRLIHAQAITAAHTEISIFNNLITLYSRSSLLSYAVRVFHLIPSPNSVSWTALISAHANSHLSLHHFRSMLRHPTLPNSRTFASLFKTCAALPAFSFGLLLHSLSLKLSLSTNPFAASALLNFYAKCRLSSEARKVFDEIPHRDGVCYSSMIVGFAQNSRPVDALSVFADMKSCNMESNEYSVSAAVRAAAELAALEQCRVLHAHAVVTGLHLNVVVGTALVDGYGKSGIVLEAQQVFEELFTDMNVVGWNALMSAYAQQGDKNSVLELFNSMLGQELEPDEYSFLAVLTSLFNASLAVDAEQWLTRMEREFGIEPRKEHYTCLVGAMGRAGRLEDAVRIAMTMPVEPDAAVWRVLLSTCAYHGAADMAWAMGKRLIELDQHDDSAYAIAANAFAAVGRWDEVLEVRKLMKDKMVKKKGGKSWIEVQGKVHLFMAGDRRHERTEEIYAKLAELMEKIEKLGYVPIWDEMLHEVGGGDKREALWSHSEKLAVAFGLVSGAAPPGKALRIVKNLRICRDCHEAFKYISVVVEREIIIRDVNRYHSFLNGSCSCRDIW